MRVDDRQLRFEDVFLRRVLLVDLGEVHGASSSNSLRLGGRYRGVVGCDTPRG